MMWTMKGQTDAATYFTTSYQTDVRNNAAKGRECTGYEGEIDVMLSRFHLPEYPCTRFPAASPRYQFVHRCTFGLVPE
ncbi:hypothetical protein BDU57DRAFT_281996 [Ampelomyces quisqualis]|uniref:Uncharacterized protein n=1 Tax=Ampelomyces quisqualis TaxID=50730 RepID=A0A6A5QM37_AMPQU|nr:hypothetical protein BDU57DRAFT_281996 [Ampelomyces quisqualis]